MFLSPLMSNSGVFSYLSQVTVVCVTFTHKLQLTESPQHRDVLRGCSVKEGIYFDHSFLKRILVVIMLVSIMSCLFSYLLFVALMISRGNHNRNMALERWAELTHTLEPEVQVDWRSFIILTQKRAHKSVKSVWSSCRQERDQRISVISWDWGLQLCTGALDGEERWALRK